MTPAIALACTLTFTAPAYEPDLRDSTGANACWDSSRYQIPERPLRAIVSGWGISDRVIAYRDTFPVTPGAWTQLIVPWDGGPYTYEVALADQSGNVTPCPARIAKGDWPVAVDPPERGQPPPASPRATLVVPIGYRPPQGWKLYDVAGRLHPLADRPGFLWEQRAGERSRRLLVVR